MPKLHSAVWFTTMACNFKCHYCWELQAQEHGLYKSSPLDENGDKWLEAWGRLGPNILDITGGEPLMHKWFIDFFEKLPQPTKFGLTTNLSYSMTEFVQRVDPKRFVGMTCSFHPTQNGTAKQPMNVDIYLGRALMLKNRGFPITVNMVTWPEQLWLIPKYKKIFEDEGLRFHADAYSSISYYPFEFSEKETAFARKYLGADRLPDELATKHGTDYRVMCSGGQTHLSVQPNGDAHRCILEHQLSINKVGNILDPDFKLLDEELPCDEQYRCPGCDRDKVKVKFVGKIDRSQSNLLPIL